MNLSTQVRTMKAAVLLRTGEPLQIVDGIELPDLQRGQVLVRLAFSGVCQSQMMEARGCRGEDRYLPHLLGHEGSGKVYAVGSGVTKVKRGDNVVLTWIRSQGIESGGVCYAHGSGVINAGAVTTFNEWAVVSENRCVPLPVDVPLDVAVLLGCAVPTGAGIVFHEMALEPEHRVAVFGLGGIGLSALMAVPAFGCRQIIAVDVAPFKLTMARDLGAHEVVDAREGDPVAEIMRLTDGQGVDFAIEAAGRTQTIEQAFASLKKPGGLCVFASHPPSGAKIQLDPHDLISGKQIRGSWGGATDPDRDIPRFAALYREGKLPLDRLVSARYPLTQINQALEDLEQRKIVRALLVIDPQLAGQNI